MKKKEQAKALWNMCFNDSQDFTDLYFRKRYTDYNTIGLSEEGAMASVMQLLPYPFRLYSSILPSAYVSGACTDPRHRNKGLMSKLLKRGLNSLNDTKIPICTLIPANEGLFNYYRQSGFETVFFNSTTTFTIDQHVDNNYSLKVEDTYSPQAFEYLNSCLSKQTCSILHTKEDYEVILEDLRFAGGKVFLLSEFGQIISMAIVYCSTEDQAMHINELQYTSTDGKEALLRQIASYFKLNSFVYTHTATPSNKEPFGMLRIIRALDVLEVFVKTNLDLRLNFYLEDALIKDNQGFYSIEKGKVSFEALKEQPADVEKWSIEQLALYLFNPLNPYMSLMLD